MQGKMDLAEEERRAALTAENRIHVVRQ
jgi:hypothetical protein